jgi:ABC-type transport system involved in multi-copper enzyme maturation permease subunit
MSPMWAIVLDTWRQSRQQVVFIIMMGLLILHALVTVAMTGKMTDEDGVEHVELAFDEGPARILEEMWVATNAQIRLGRGEEDFDPRDPEAAKQIQDLLVERAKVDAESAPPLRRGVETMIFVYANFSFTLSMLLFIGACAGYYPNMLESGGIDMVLAKPLDRLKVFLGKYLGGLVLFSALIALVYLVVFFGIGIRTGVWPGGIFLAMPLQIFAAAVVYAILAAIGTFTRNSTLCLIVGYVFYLVIDSAVSALVQLNRLHVFKKYPTLEGLGDLLESVFPNFALLKTNASASVLSFPSMEAKPLLVALAWAVGCIALGYWKFSRTDY